MKTLTVTSMLFAFFAASLMAGSQQPAPEHAGSAAQKGPDMKTCQEMAGRHQKMMEAMKSMDAQLEKEVQAMQAAQGPAKVDAIARVVATLVEQRRQMRERAMAMQGQMSGHMMQHAGQSQDAMMQCPMMRQMMKGQEPPVR